MLPRKMQWDQVVFSGMFAMILTIHSYTLRVHLWAMTPEFGAKHRSTCYGPQAVIKYHARQNSLVGHGQEGHGHTLGFGKGLARLTW